MRIAVIGTGLVGRTIAGRLVEIGHDVTIGTREVAATMGRTEPDGSGNPPYPEWAAAHKKVGLATFADAAAGAEIVVNASSGTASLDALTAAGAGNLAGKVLLDVANPLDFSGGFPPTLFVKDTDSLAEQIQRAFPDARVVKSLNTTNASVMTEPGTLSEETSVFVSGDDADAKAAVTELLTTMGHTDIIDLGGLETARGAEMFLPLWLRLMNALGTPQFNIKIVR